MKIFTLQLLTAIPTGGVGSARANPSKARMHLQRAFCFGVEIQVAGFLRIKE
jgi:hypothetical protein